MKKLTHNVSHRCTVSGTPLHRFLMQKLPKIPAVWVLVVTSKFVVELERIVIGPVNGSARQHSNVSSLCGAQMLRRQTRCRSCALSLRSTDESYMSGPTRRGHVFVSFALSRDAARAMMKHHWNGVHPSHQRHFHCVFLGGGLFQ